MNLTNIIENVTIAFTNNNSTKESNKEPEESDLVTIGLFFAYLAVGFFLVFLMIGLCILSHLLYIKYFKKPWYELKFYI